MVKEIPKSDIVVRPFKVFKEWSLDQTDVTPIIGKEITDSLFDENTDPTSQGYYQRLIFDSIKAQFYNNPTVSSVLTEVGNRKNYTSEDERALLKDSSFDTIWVLSIPQKYYGEGIKMGSVELRDDVNNVTYSDDGNSNLVSEVDSQIHGNVFYDRGLIVMHDVDEVNSELSNFRINYRSTVTIYENEVFLSVLESEFNVSQNPSAVDEDGGKKITIPVTKPHSLLRTRETVNKTIYQSGIKYIRNQKHPFTSSYDNTTEGSFDDYETKGSNDQTGSYLTPFITTIGLYDDDLNMVAVAKLPKPIKSLPDYPVNFIVRFDT